jgi:anti-sigma factor RsiW
MQELITAYADGELEPTQRDATERHLAQCPACAVTLANLTAMKASMRADALLFNAPGALVKRIDALIDKTAGPRNDPQNKPTPTQPKIGPKSWPKWWPAGLAASVLVAGGIAAYLLFWPNARQRLDAEAVAAHQRAVATNHLVDFATNDPQKLSAWFSAQISFAPMVPNRILANMTLVGGRLDALDGNRVAVVVFRDGTNVAEAFEFPSRAAADGPTSESTGGANVTSRNTGAMGLIFLSEGGPESAFNLSSMFTVDGCSTH